MDISILMYEPSPSNVILSLIVSIYYTMQLHFVITIIITTTIVTNLNLYVSQRN